MLGRVGAPESVAISNDPGHVVRPRDAGNGAAEAYRVHLLVEPIKKLRDPLVGFLNIRIPPRHRSVRPRQRDPDARALSVLSQLKINAMIDDIDDPHPVRTAPAVRNGFDGPQPGQDRLIPVRITHAITLTETPVGSRAPKAR